MESTWNERKKFEFWKIRKMISGLFIADTFRQILTADVLLIAPDAARNERTHSGQLFCRLFDPMSSELEKQGFSVCHLNRSPSKLSPEQTFSGALTYNRSHAIFLLASLILGGSRGFKLRTNWARRLIRMSGARVIFTWEGQAELRAAAKEEGIPCVEVIHGSGYPADGAVGWITGSEGVWPSHVICFDKVTYETIESLAPATNTKVLLGENFWLASFPKDRKVSRQPDHNAMGELFPIPRRRDEYTAKILVTLGWGHAAYRSESPLNLVWKFLSEAGNSVFCRIRFHPVQLSSNRQVDRETIRQTKLRFSKLKHVDIEECQQIPLPLLAMDSTHHITVDSMSAYEMAECGVPTLFLSDDLSFGPSMISPTKYEDLISEGFATVGCESTGELFRWIENTGIREPREKAREGDRVESLLRQILG